MPGNNDAAYLSVRGINKRFGTDVGVFDIDLDVQKGSALCLLGPSGCGKTTLLRIVAGLLEADSGSVRLGGNDLSRVPVHKRDIGFVFQTWALFPHLNVRRNVEFGLSMRGIDSAERGRRARDALALVGLEELSARMPRQLSGGQQQRVALARALAINPSILLLDEPMSSLDFNTRVEVRRQIRELQQRLGVTAIYVTHDYSEAMAVADRTIVMSGGRIVERGETAALFHHPGTDYAARFLGMHNVLDGTVATIGDAVARVRIGNGLEVGVPLGDAAIVANAPVKLCFDQWTVAIGAEGMPAEVISVTAEHGYTRIVARPAGMSQNIDFRVPGISLVAPGAQVRLAIDWGQAWFLKSV